MNPALAPLQHLLPAGLSVRCAWLLCLLSAAAVPLSCGGGDGPAAGGAQAPTGAAAEKHLELGEPPGQPATGDAQKPEPPKETAADYPQLKIETLKEGSGDAIEHGMTGKFHYVGTLADGKQFDSSYERGEPASFALQTGSVIKGWVLGLRGMKVGEKRRLVIPPELAYADQGQGGVPPNAVLVFEVELVDLVK